MSKPNTPHDALFKFAFSQVEEAAGELRHVLPAALSSRIDFATLTAVPGSFVDEALRERHSDLLFSAELAGRPALLYLLFEHQSTVVALMPFRVLSYMVRIWDKWLSTQKDPPQSLPLIVPIVVHHSDTGWTAAVALEDILDVESEVLAALGPHVPRLQFVLDDVSQQSDEALHSRAMTALGRAVLWCLRDGRTPGEILRKLERWAEVVREVARAPNGVAALSALFRYISEVSDIRTEELQETILAEVGEEVRDAMTTAADRLREEGRREGRLEGERAMLLRMLTARFGQLPPTVTARIGIATVDEVEAWAERVLVAKTLAEVLGDA